MYVFRDFGILVIQPGSFHSVFFQGREGIY